jgi:hypothetical protein
LLIADSDIALISNQQSGIRNQQSRNAMTSGDHLTQRDDHRVGVLGVPPRKASGSRFPLYSSLVPRCGVPLQSLTRVLLLLSICFTGCDADRPEVEAEVPHIAVDVESLDSADLEQNSEPPIDIVSLKKETWLEVTSGVAGKVERSAMCGIDSTGFVGFYFLIDKENGGERVGKLTVQHPGKPSDWTYDNTDERFVAFELNSPRVDVWNTLAVGDSASKIDAFVQGHFHYKKGTWIVASIGSYQGEFQILNGRIEMIKVHISCPPELSPRLDRLSSKQHKL